MAIKLPREKPATESPERVINPDGSLAPRPGAGILPTTVDWASVPKGNGATQDSTAVPEPAPKPNLSVARQVLGREIGSLKMRLAHAERALEYETSRPLPAPGPYSPVEHFIARRQSLAEDISNLRADIARLESLSPSDVIDWAWSHGWR